MQSEQTVVVAAAIDDSFAVPLLVMLRSAGRRLSPGWRLDVHVIGDQIREQSKRRVQLGLEDLPIRLSWTTLDLSKVRDHWPGIRGDGDLTRYFRLYLGEVFPESVERVLFLDADLLVEGDLAELWKLPFHGNIVQAVPDAYASLLHIPRLSKVCFTEDVHFEYGTPYFNAGVQLIDLRRWREERIRKRTEAFLWKYGHQLFMRDQDALNCSLLGRWKALPPTWNFHELPHLLYQWETGGISRAELRRTFHDPKIIHFIGWKPWNGRCSQVYCERWWKVAREVKVPEPRLSLLARLRHRHLREPHARMNWHVWRDILQASDLSHWRSAGALLVRYPWMLLTYPLWLVAVWVRFNWTRRGSPQRCSSRASAGRQSGSLDGSVP